MDLDTSWREVAVRARLPGERIHKHDQDAVEYWAWSLDRDDRWKLTRELVPLGRATTIQARRFDGKWILLAAVVPVAQREKFKAWDKQV